MIDKERLAERLDEMSNLPVDWDGFGTGPISSNVKKIASRLIEYATLDPDKDSLRVFVGVNNPGSVFVEIVRSNKIFELTIISDGTIFYEEISEGIEIGSGMFLLSKKKIDDILSE